MYSLEDQILPFAGGVYPVICVTKIIKQYCSKFIEIILVYT